MLLTPPNGPEEIWEFYEFDPERHVRDGQATPEWEAKMVLVPTPRPLLFLGQPVHRIRVHHKIATITQMTLEAVDREGLWDVIEVYSGSYLFRPKRLGAVLSMHAFGAGLDFDAERNSMGRPIGQTPMGGTRRGWRTVLLFEEMGWTWGGWFPTPDAMHLQFGKGY
jgi:hypothetical protein